MYVETVKDVIVVGVRLNTVGNTQEETVMSNTYMTVQMVMRVNWEKLIRNPTVIKNEFRKCKNGRKF
jgi:hypothetical protein